MLQKSILYTLGLFLLLAFIASSAYAIPFTGDAWIAQHFENGTATHEYYLVVNEANITNVKVHGFSFLSEGDERDFSGLTGVAGNEGISWLEVDNANSVLVGSSLESMTFKLYFRAESGIWYQGVIGFASFENPVGGEETEIGGLIDELPNGDGGTQTASVPEPATLILLGTGLLGIVTLRKRLS